MNRKLKKLGVDSFDDFFFFLTMATQFMPPFINKHFTTVGFNLAK